MAFGDRRTPLRRTELKRGTSELKRTELKRGTTPMPKTGRKSKADTVTLRKSKAVIEERSGGYCEFRILGICTGEARHHHHRQTGHSNHDPEAMAHLCNACHDAAHLDSARYERGWLVKHPTDPATVLFLLYATPSRP